MIELVKWQKDFAEDITIYANNKKISNNLRDLFPHPYTFEDAQDFISSCLKTDEKNNV